MEEMIPNQMSTGTSELWIRIWSDFHLCLFYEDRRVRASAPRQRHLHPRHQTCDHFCFSLSRINIQECERGEEKRWPWPCPCSLEISALLGPGVSSVLCRGRGQCLHSYLPSSHSQHRYGNLARNTHNITHKWEKWDMGSWHKIWRRVVTSVPMSLMSHINPDPDVSDVTAHVSHGIPHPRAVWPCVETRDGVLGVIPTQSYTHAHYQDGWFTLSLSLISLMSKYWRSVSGSNIQCYS